MKRNTGQLPLVFDPTTQGPRPPAPPPRPAFDGHTYDPARDRKRLSALLDATRRFLADGMWHTLEEIHEATGGSMCSVSARVRDLRKPRFGGHEVRRRRKPGGPAGVWQYRLILRG